MNTKITEKGWEYFSWFWLAACIVVFFVMTGSHLWAAVVGKSALNIKTVLANIFWSCVLYSVLGALYNTDFEGRCFYCDKNVYSGLHHLVFDWEEKTVESQSIVSLQKVAHFSCHKNAPPEKKFCFPNYQPKGVHKCG